MQVRRIIILNDSVTNINMEASEYNRIGHHILCSLLYLQTPLMVSSVLVLVLGPSGDSRIDP